MEKRLSPKKGFFESDSFRLFMGKYGIGVILFFMLVALSIAEPNFRSGRNLMNVAKQVAINGSIAFGMCLVITAGGIDLTVGSQLALSAVLIGEFVIKRGWSVYPAALLTLAVTTTLGLINGVLISKFNMFPFVVTLSMQLVIRGIAQVISNAQAISITDATTKAIYTGKLGAVPIPVIILVTLAIIMYFLLHWTKLGRYILAVGGNEKAAVASGVNVFWTKVMTYTISGFTAGLAGIILCAKTSSAQSNLGVGYETDAIAACVIGGTSFAGGVATIPGTLMGIIIIGLIYNGMNMIGISSYYQSIVKGCMIILSVLFDMLINKKK